MFNFRKTKLCALVFVTTGLCSMHAMNLLRTPVESPHEVAIEKKNEKNRLIRKLKTNIENILESFNTYKKNITNVYTPMGEDTTTKTPDSTKGLPSTIQTLPETHTYNTSARNATTATHLETLLKIVKQACKEWKQWKINEVKNEGIVQASTYIATSKYLAACKFNEKSPFKIKEKQSKGYISSDELSIHFTEKSNFLAISLSITNPEQNIACKIQIDDKYKIKKVSCIRTENGQKMITEDFVEPWGFIRSTIELAGKAGSTIYLEKQVDGSYKEGDVSRLSRLSYHLRRVFHNFLHPFSAQ